MICFQKFPLSKHVTFLLFKIHSTSECIKTLNISFIIHLSLKWEERLQIDSFLSWINLVYFSSTKKGKMPDIRIDDIIVEFGEHICQQLVLYINTIYGYKLYSSSRRPFPLFARCILHKGAAQQSEKKLARSFNFTCSYIDDFLYQIIVDLVILLIASISLSLR